MKKIVLFLVLNLILILTSACNKKDQYIVISYETNGGIELKPQYIYEDVHNQYIEIVTTKEGYRFIGWFTDPNFDPNSKVVHNQQFFKDTTLYAKWEIMTYIVTVTYFDFTKTYAVEYGKELVFEKLEINGFYFQYFYYNETKISDSIIVKEDMCINASFEG